MGEYVLEAINITKKFPGVIANDCVNIAAKKGEVLGLIGENGAGKSTLLKVLNGVYPHGSYTGALKIDGQTVEPTDTMHALALGVGFVPQEINVFKNMSVAENIFISDLTMGAKKGFVAHKELYEKTRQVLAENNVSLDPRQDVRKLSIGQQQMLMIVKALASKPKILILDEPTTSLSNSDVEKLFNVVRELKNKGTCVIFVTHKMEEILELTDRVCVLRDGKNVGLFERVQYDKNLIIEAMIGRKITMMYPQRNAKIGEVMLRVENLCVEHPYIQNRHLLRNISFDVRSGEVLGLAGLVGAGRTEVVSALYGMLRTHSGKVIIKGKTVHIKNPTDAVQNGIALVTEDRKKYGLVHIWSILKNISLSNLKKACSFNMVVSPAKEQERAGKYFSFLNIKAPSMRARVDTLSGGNQQKVVIGRSLNSEPSIIMLDEPTKGIDVGSKNEIYRLINELAEQGNALIMISSELPELMAMCDRFIVLAEGQISGVLSKDDATNAKVMEYAVATFKKGEVPV